MYVWLHWKICNIFYCCCALCLGCATVQSHQYFSEFLGKLFHFCCVLYTYIVYIYRALGSIIMNRLLSLKEFRRLSVYGMTVITVAYGAHSYMKVQQHRLEENIYKKMEEGNNQNPRLMIAREDLSKELFEFYFPGVGSKVKNYFGVVIGPTGTGKSALVTSECNKHPGGVLYYNACEPQVFAKELAEAIGMKVGPSNILDLFLGYFSSDVFVYYHLPEKQVEAINLIFKNLTKAAKRYKAHKGKVATLFIDGSDVLCKFENKLFNHLLY